MKIAVCVHLYHIDMLDSIRSYLTNLEHEYETKLTENLFVGDIEKKRAWLTYNQVILELKHALKNT